jgi:hypothetical protein
MRTGGAREQIKRLFLVSGPEVETIAGDGDDFTAVCFNLKLITEIH